MKQSKKTKFLTTGLAVALAAATLVGGGTFAYLQSSTGDVVNQFDANKVMVSLAETTGSEYHIIPGTSQEKDPAVTVDNTVDAYVYVEVNDATDGLVTYSIADGWTLLDGYDNVYYREVAADAADKAFDVLKDNIVSYSADLENSDMLDGEGNLKDGMELTFQAYAIQKDGFVDAADACPLTPAGSLAEAIENAEEGDVLTVTGEVTEPVSIDKSITVNNLNASAPVTVAADAVTLNNAKIEVTHAAAQAVTVPITVTDFTMTDSEISADTGSGGNHTAVNIAAGGHIVFSGNTVTNPSYNGVEFSQSVQVASLTISGNNFTNCGNNAISIYNVQADAVITIDNNTFTNVSNAIRLSNYSNATATFNISNNTADTDTMYEKAFVLLQAVRGEDFSNYTLNFKGNTLGQGGVYAFVYNSTTEPIINYQ